MAKMIDVGAILDEWPEDANPSWRKLASLLPRYVDQDLRDTVSALTPSGLFGRVSRGEFDVEAPESASDFPAEVWMLRHKSGGGFVPSFDQIRDGECYLCVLTEREAKILADTQHKRWDMDCEPVRVK